jgi:hypothetical protein
MYRPRPPSSRLAMKGEDRLFSSRGYWTKSTVPPTFMSEVTCSSEGGPHRLFACGHCHATGGALPGSSSFGNRFRATIGGTDGGWRQGCLGSKKQTRLAPDENHVDSPVPASSPWRRSSQDPPAGGSKSAKLLVFWASAGWPLLATAERRPGTEREKEAVSSWVS